MTQSNPALQVAGSAANEFEAGLLKAALEESGIPVFLEGIPLADQWNSFQNFAGIGITIKVPTELLQEARGVIEALRRGDHAIDPRNCHPQAPASRDDDADDETEGDAATANNRWTALTWSIFILTVLLGPLAIAHFVVEIVRAFR